MDNKVTIRNAKESDIETVIEIWKEFIDFHKERDRLLTRRADGHEYFAKFFRENMEKETSHVLVAEIAGKIVGYCQNMIVEFPPVLVTEKYGNVMDMAVTEKYRSQGIGEKFFNEAKKWFREKGLERLEVRVLAANEIATNFWRKMGFKPYLETVYMEI